jgi:hypothetical protein
LMWLGGVGMKLMNEGIFLASLCFLYFILGFAF